MENPTIIPVYQPPDISKNEAKRMIQDIRKQEHLLAYRYRQYERKKERLQRIAQTFEKLNQRLESIGEEVLFYQEDEIGQQDQDFIEIKDAFKVELDHYGIEEKKLQALIFDQLESLKKHEFVDLDALQIDRTLLEEEVLEQQVDQLPQPQQIQLCWQPIDFHDDFRAENAAKSGGLIMQDREAATKLRSVAKEILREIGRKILSGDLNLTRISFPIKCMQGNSALHSILKAAMMNPIYLNQASQTSDRVERIKFFIIATIASFIHTSTFIKPLNPILGETQSARTPDGTIFYSEQTSHHPPISHLLIYGPNNCYKMNGYYNFFASAGLNSVTIRNTGTKQVEFPDGHAIKVNSPVENFHGTFMGEIRHETVGVLNYSDNEGYKCDVKFGEARRKPSDLLTGQIMGPDGSILSQLTGTYAGYIDFDGIRYWDFRVIQPPVLEFPVILPSDSEVRKDLGTLRTGDLLQAQIDKEELENVQRRDRKLREQYGGASHQ